MRFLIAGSSGFLGSLLRERLTAEGHDVTALVRREPGPAEVRWDPYVAGLGAEVVDNADVVVNLAGSALFGNPHSKKYLHAMRESRVRTTRLLAEAIAAGERKPAFLAGNGTSYYGARGDEVLDEDSGTSGDSFMTRLTRDWEQATGAAAQAGARVCVLRTPPVLDRRGLTLRLLSTVFRLGLGGPLGTGRQYFPAISARDWVAAVTFLATHDEIAGPVNLVLPQVPTNAEFTRALADALHRPAFLRVPASAIRLAAGPMAPELLNSVRATPAALLRAGFTFDDPTIDDVLTTGLRSGG